MAKGCKGWQIERKRVICKGCQRGAKVGKGGNGSKVGKGRQRAKNDAIREGNKIGVMKHVSGFIMG